MIFQDPYSSLNPRMTVGSIIEEPLEIQNIGHAAERRRRVPKMLKLFGLNPYVVTRFPHEFSGAQRQRIGIARALSTKPAFIVADDPISALDASVQAQGVKLLANLKTTLGLTLLFISRNLSKVGHLSDRIAVMHLGRIVELGSRDGIFDQQYHPYTQALLRTTTVPDREQGSKRRLSILEQDAYDLAAPPSACRYHPRCAYATDICRLEDPEFRDLGTAETPHVVACHHAEQFM